MIYLAHTAHRQFLGLIAGFLAWILIMATAGLDEWRLWRVEDVSVVTSGVAWVGIWRACFYSQVLPQFENCRSLSISDDFLPTEIRVAQVLIVLAVVCSLAANVIAALAMRMVYFSVENRRNLRPMFLLAGSLHVLTGTFCLVPLVWNVTSVLNNSAINFPPEYDLPAAPVSQQIGSAIAVGIFASILMLISGLLFLCYRYAWKALSSEAPRDPGDPLHGPWTEMTLAQTNGLPKGDKHGTDNPAFHSGEAS